MTKTEQIKKLEKLANELGVELVDPKERDATKPEKVKGPKMVQGNADDNIKLKVEKDAMQLTTDLTKAYETAKNGKTKFVAKTEHREWVPLMENGKNSGYAFQLVVVYNPDKDER